jgi:hypothetical protein
VVTIRHSLIALTQAYESVSLFAFSQVTLVIAHFQTPYCSEKSKLSKSSMSDTVHPPEMLSSTSYTCVLLLSPRLEGLLTTSSASSSEIFVTYWLATQLSWNLLFPEQPSSRPNGKGIDALPHILEQFFLSRVGLYSVSVKNCRLAICQSSQFFYCYSINLTGHLLVHSYTVTT